MIATWWEKAVNRMTGGVFGRTYENVCLGEKEALRRCKRANDRVSWRNERIAKLKDQIRVRDQHLEIRMRSLEEKKSLVRHLRQSLNETFNTLQKELVFKDGEIETHIKRTNFATGMANKFIKRCENRDREIKKLQSIDTPAEIVKLKTENEKLTNHCKNLKEQLHGLNVKLDSAKKYIREGGEKARI